MREFVSAFGVTKEELYWVAGLLEGEGCFMIKHNSIGVTCAMTDKDVIARLHRLLGVGNIQTPKPTKGGKVLYTWYLGMREDVVALISELEPLMSDRRRKKILEMLEWNDSNPKSEQRGLKTAKHGSHRMYTHYGCRCKECVEFQSTYRRSRRRKVIGN